MNIYMYLLCKISSVVDLGLRYSYLPQWIHNSSYGHDLLLGGKFVLHMEGGGRAGGFGIGTQSAQLETCVSVCVHEIRRRCVC